MVIGIPKEIKVNEDRVSLAPSAVARLVKEGHKVLVEKGAGLGAGYTDLEYKAAGAKIVQSHKKIFEDSELIVKVKEPLPEEYPLLRKGLIMFTFLHLAASHELIKALLEKNIVALAYETVQTSDNDLPLLAPMSEIAGRMAPLVGAHFLMKPAGQRGILASGVAGVPPANFVIVGAGHVGTNAARVAVGLGANVYLLDKNLRKLRTISDIFRGANLITMGSDEHAIATVLSFADVLILAILVPGARTPIIVPRDLLKTMKPGSVIVDVSIDQGGAAETSQPTTHLDPVYEVDKVIHYCVTNMPGAVPRTSTRALSMATIDYVSEVARKGWKIAALENEAIARGVNLAYGHVTHPIISQTFNLKYVPFTKVL